MISANEAVARPDPPDLADSLAAAASGHPVFEEEQKTLLKQLQHFLHAYPTTVPFLVLLLGVAVFSVVVGGRFFHPFNLSLILQQVTIIGIVGIAVTTVVFLLPFAFILLTAMKPRNEANLLQFSWPTEMQLWQNIVEVVQTRDFMLIIAFINKRILERE